MKVWTDGSTTNYCVVFEDEQPSVVPCLMKVTGNVGEYYAVIHALVLARTKHDLEVEVYSDSELVVRQLTGAYTCKNPRLRQLFRIVKNLEKSFSRVSYTWVSRKENPAGLELERRLKCQ